MEERRRFFRLDDEVVMDFQAISSEEFAHWKEHQTLQKSELQELEKEIGILIHQLRSSHPAVGQVIELFNRKINLLHGHGDQQAQLNLSAAEARVRVNLSACGMSFTTSEDLSKQTHLLFDLQLKPSNAMLTLAGTIVSVEKTHTVGDTYLVRVNFEGLKETEQELLIQHLFQLQSRTLRQQRDQ